MRPRSLGLPFSGARANSVYASKCVGDGRNFNDTFKLTAVMSKISIRSTTILAVRHHGNVAMGGDGQVTLNTSVMKADAMKIRRLLDGHVLCGFCWIECRCLCFARTI